MSLAQQEVENLPHISSLPEEILSLILTMVDVKDVYNFLQTSLDLGHRAYKIFLIKAIETKFIYKDGLYHKSLDELRLAHNILFEPGNLYKICKPKRGYTIQLYNCESRYTYGKFIKIYSDGYASGAALSSDGSVHLYGKIVSSLKGSKPPVFGDIIAMYPPNGEKYVDVYINQCSKDVYTCILISNKGKCYSICDMPSGVIENVLNTTPEKCAYPTSQLPGIKQVQIDMHSNTGLFLTKTNEVLGVGWHDKLRFHYQPVNLQTESDLNWHPNPVKILENINVTYINKSPVNRYTFVTDEGYVYQSYDHTDHNFLEKLGITPIRRSGIYQVPGLKNIIQAHSSVHSISIDHKYASIEFNIFLDKRGCIHFYLISKGPRQQLVKGPYKLPNFNNIVKVSLRIPTVKSYEECSYGFVTMEGKAYASIGEYGSLDWFLRGLENLRLITLPPKMLAKDITIDEDNIYLLLQKKKKSKVQQ